MDRRDLPGPGGETPRERISRLSAAILRISASLDVATVLREVVDSARALTGARNGVIATVDEAGRPRDFVTSGLTPDEERRMAGWLPDGLRLFEHLRDLEAPLRSDDFPAYVRALGYSPDLIPCTTFQGTPMRHRGVHVGSFFLGDKEGAGGFTGEDEELLVLFASQAATAIANARTHRDERRARADDADDNRAHTDAAVLSFAVTIDDARTAQVQRSVKRTLAAVGHRALDNTAARFPASIPASALRVRRAAPLGAGAATAIAGRGRSCPPDAFGQGGFGAAR